MSTTNWRYRRHDLAVLYEMTWGKAVRARVTDGSNIFFTAATNRPWQSDGLTLLGLHGGPGIDGSQMRYFLEPAQEWSTVVVPDQRGHGLSDRSEPAKWTLSQWAEDVHDLIQRLGLEDVILVGTSFGGFVAQHFLAAYPGVARGAVIIGSSPRRASVDEIVERYRDVGGDEAASVMRLTMTEPGPTSEAEWGRVCAPLSRIRPPDDGLDRIQRERINTPEVNAHFMKALAGLDLRADLAAATDPILVMVGEKDPLTPPRLAAEIQQHAPHADVTVEVVAGASHQVLWDQPSQTLDRIREFARLAIGGPEVAASAPGARQWESPPATRDVLPSPAASLGRSLAFRDARHTDIPSIVKLYGDDVLGATRETVSEPPDEGYLRAFAQIDADPRHRLIVVEDEGELVATLQLSFLPHLVLRGGERAQIEAVRVRSDRRAGGLGETVFRWAIDEARQRGCRLVQLTTNVTRTDAQRFYERLGFEASHVGMKLMFDRG